jgi:hypothetical protein
MFLFILGVFYIKSTHKNKEYLFWKLSVVNLLQEQVMDWKHGWENPSNIVWLKVREQQYCWCFVNM